MKTFRELEKLVQYLADEEEGKPLIRTYRIVLEDNVEIIDLLRLLEKVNPCGQEYHLHQGLILVSYVHNLNLLNFTRKFSLKAKVRIIGLPISLSLGGILSTKDANAIDKESERVAVREVLKEMEGLTLVLNSDFDLSGGNRTLSTFVFHNRFSDFQDYLNALRAPYRRKISKALEKGKGLKFIPISPLGFTEQHYALYLSVMGRTRNLLETLPIDFFRGYDADIIEVRDEESRLVGFVQLRGSGSGLYFMFCGFRRNYAGPDDLWVEPGVGSKREESLMNSIDLYYNMLLFIIRFGIEKGYGHIQMGQTSEETKLKLGCEEVGRYLCLHHGNAVVNRLLQALARRFSYRGYPVKHHTFKREYDRIGTELHLSKAEQPGIVADMDKETG